MFGFIVWQISGKILPQQKGVFVKSYFFTKMDTMQTYFKANAMHRQRINKSFLNLEKAKNLNIQFGRNISKHREKQTKYANIYCSMFREKLETEKMYSKAENFFF